MNLPQRLTEIARLSPTDEALVYQNERISYAQLNGQINQLANGLRELGISPGDRVMIALGNCPEFVISYYAILRIRAIAVPVNPQFTINEIGFIMRDATPAAVVASQSVLHIFTELAEQISIPRGIIVIRNHPVGMNMHSYKRVLANSSTTFFPDGQHERDDVALLLYTSGTTGTPKGAMLTHHNIYSNATTFTQLCNLQPRDRSLLVAPAYHAAAQTCVMNSTLMAGATLVIHDGWTGPEPVLQTIQDEKITFFFGPPTMYVFLINCPGYERYDISSWRIAFTGASALSAELFKAFEEKFGFQPTEGYGLTETSPVVTTNIIDGPKKIGSIGKPIPGVSVKVVDYEDREVKPGQVGEIVVQGPNVMMGYFNAEEETRWAMRNGWLHTGDLAYVDDEGYLFIVDRKKDIIIRGGMNVYPREVEEVLYTHPRVFEAAVVGVSDPVMGEEVLAFVLLRDGETMAPQELKEYCADKLAPYKIPHYIHFVENLPKTTSGKVLKRELRGMAQRI